MIKIAAPALTLPFLLATAAGADPAPEPAAAPPAGTAAPTAQPRDIIVTAPVQTSERDVLQGTSVLSGEELARELRPTIGETLARQPGVSATSFGPSASRPILRGLQGDRIRVLTDGVGSVDVSNTSVDHAVVIDPLLAERIEVLRGPAALLYGSSAVGGVVNVIDARIPRRIPANGYKLDATATYGSAADERSGGAAGDVAVGSNIVLHADGSYLKAGDLRTGDGYILAPAARRAALSQVGLPQDTDEPIDFAASAALRDRLPNTAAETWTAGVGAALITDTGNLGVSYSHYDSLYGVPIRYATAVGQEQEAPRLDVVQNRFDVRGEVETGGGFLDTIRARAVYANYRHFELEPDNSIGTAFYNKGIEGRLEAVQAKRGAWSGASGVQVFNRQFDVEGDEAFLPRNETTQTGLFTLQQLDYGAFKLEGGARYETTTLNARGAADDLRFFRGTRDFDAVSASLGGSYGLSDAVRVGVNLSRTERTPTAEELFANGPHAGTQAYELGDPNFSLEKSWGLEGTLHVHGDGFSLDASAYYTRFTNYISENQVDPSVCQAAADPSGRTVDLPCFQYQQRDAHYWGLEADASAKLATIGGYRINADVLGDYVRATIVDQGPAPRIPPMRVLGGVEAQGEKLTARGEVEHVFDQTRTADFETSTPGYTMVNASVAWKPWGSERTAIVLSANNLFDVLARRHSSFLKDFAPLAGRDIRVTLKLGI
jgi:iron complex outermembrane receptor protein